MKDKFQTIKSQADIEQQVEIDDLKTRLTKLECFVEQTIVINIAASNQRHEILRDLVGDMAKDVRPSGKKIVVGSSIIEIDAGEMVICDVCNDDYTESDAMGGCIYNNYAYCPKCASKINDGPRVIRFLNDVPFRESVLQYRARQ